MTVAELVERAKALTPEERKQLIDSITQLDTPKSQPLTGAEIVKNIRDIPPIEFVDSHIEDPVEWVQAQRQKRKDYIDSLMKDADE